MDNQHAGTTWLTSVRIAFDSVHLIAEIAVPQSAQGLVIFAHGSGSSRRSPRNKLVAEKLRRRNLGTLLVDLLTENEDTDYSLRFDIDLLTERLVFITDWAARHPATEHLKIGYFGASTGAAAALLAATAEPNIVMAIVSRGGRVDLAGGAPKRLQAPTMLIVGEHDLGVREANEEFFLELKCKKELAIIPKATHLFEEPGALEQVAEHAAEWFSKYLKSD